jgi:hypothetical protein
VRNRCLIPLAIYKEQLAGKDGKSITGITRSLPPLSLDIVRMRTKILGLKRSCELRQASDHGDSKEFVNDYVISVPDSTGPTVSRACHNSAVKARGELILNE